MSEPRVEEAGAAGGALPDRRRAATTVLVAVAVAVVVVGLALGGALALALARSGGDGTDPPGEDEIRLALATQHGLDPDTTACVLAELRRAETLEDVLTSQLVADAIRGVVTPSAPVDAALDACGSGRLLDALAVGGVPDPVASCAAATLIDQPSAVQAAVAEAPLAADAPGRGAVAACALEHLATELESSTGIAGTDARCVAGGVLDRLGLETVLASIGALAVTAEVAGAATTAAEACAAG